MRIAISSTGNKTSSAMDPRFGRCSYFCIFDTSDKTIEFITNPAKELSGGAGPAAAQHISGFRINKVISGDFGGKVIPLFEALNIEVQTLKNQQTTIAEIIKQQ